ncbi:glycosyltransferase family protein [Bradyrhizobium australiense]|uniref:Glycosyltransferase family 1 protein n=1 Tax=Bradyrhizobium australiense TaxID=2721161 RepID=A0A7Y4LYI5_9BRAD|nr:glycosyltransferase [Bradyrhizobium australiense]NOJ43319.1 glycosyltransferase family 1 protein [Bradyrhizobium australiense]
MRILEISRSGFFKALQPDSTLWIRWGSPLTADEPHRPEAFGSSTTASALLHICNKTYDLIVLPAIHPDHRFDQPLHKLIAKSMLRAFGRSPAFSRLLNRLLIGTNRHAIIDVRDERNLCETTIRLFPRNTLYFKRELDLDRTTDPQALDRVRPLSLFVPDERCLLPPRGKDIDIFFAGALCNSIRTDALDAAHSLAARGLRVVTPCTPLPYPEFMAALARSWLVLSPEGYGWDCYRHYEACLAGSVPVINSPSYRRRLYLEDGVHCFYYDADQGSLVDQLPALLVDKDRLLRMAEAGRRHILANHTRSAVANYMLKEIFGGGPAMADLLPRIPPADTSGRMKVPLNR